MSFLLRTSLTAALRAHIPAATPAVASLASLATHSRLYSSKNGNDDRKYKSILNDNLLEKAGVNTDEPLKEELKEANQKFEKDTKEEEDEFARTKRRRNNTQSTLDKKKDRWAKLFWLSVVAGGVGLGAYLTRDWDKEKEPLLYKEEENGYTAKKMYTRLRRRVSGVSGVFDEPAFTNFLPPAAPVPAGLRQPMTLVLELDDTLVHSEWNRQKGWRTAKRPGVDYFIAYLSQYYELVVFSKSPQAFAENTVSKLDPYQMYFLQALYREVCTVKDRKVTKDLRFMNRPLNKIIMIDPHADCGSLQPENTIPIKAWDGKKDNELVALIPFLEYLANQPVKDVRQVLASFKDKADIPEEFALREAKLRKAWAEEQKLRDNNSWMSKILGLPSATRYPRTMPLDAIREAGQRNYQNIIRYVQENGEKMKREQEERAKKFMESQNLTLGKIVTEGMPTAEDMAKREAEMAAEEAAAK